MNNSPTEVCYSCSLCPEGKEATFGDPENHRSNGSKEGLYIERGLDFQSWVAKIRGHLITYHQSSFSSIPVDISPYIKARYHYPPQERVDQPASR